MIALPHLLSVSRAHLDACRREIRRIVEVGRPQRHHVGHRSACLQPIRKNERHTIRHEQRTRPISHRRNGHWDMGYVYDDRVENWLPGCGDAARRPPRGERRIQALFGRVGFG